MDKFFLIIFALSALSLIPSSNAEASSCGDLFQVDAPTGAPQKIQTLWQERNYARKKLAVIEKILKANEDYSKKTSVQKSYVLERNLPLGDVEKQKLEANKEKLTEKIKAFDADVLRHENLYKPFLLELITNFVAENPEAHKIVFDRLNIYRLASLEPSQTVAIFAGNSVEEFTQNMGDELFKLARSLSKKGYTVVYDGDAKTANVITAAVGDRGVALHSASFSGAKSDKHFQFSNDYEIFEALLIPSTIIASPDSVLGAAAAVYGKVSMVFDPDLSAPRSLAAWPALLRSTGRDLGLRFDVYAPYAFAGPLIKSKKRKDGQANFPKVESPKKPKLTLELADLSFGKLLKIYEHARTLLGGERALDGQAGAVIFGSSNADKPYVRKVEDVARLIAERGLPIITGGAGGFMQLANSAAMDMGVESIGIYIGGRYKLSSESDIPRDVHTLSIAVSDYNERIPLLLNGRELIVFVPGKFGTMRELSTTLLKAWNSPNQKAPILFIDAHYYGELVAWLRASPLPNEILQRVHLIHDVGGLRRFFDSESGE